MAFEAVMSSVIVRKIGELDATGRAWIASLFGNDLPEEQEVTVALGPRIRIPSPKDREAARNRLELLLKEMHAQVKDVPPDEMEAVLDDAMKAVRPSYEPLR